MFTSDNLRTLFQHRFSQASWLDCLQRLFCADELRANPDPVYFQQDEGFYWGAINTMDHFRIGLFHFQIHHGSVVRRRVGLRNLVSTFTNPRWGEFDAALVVFDSGDHWRLSFVCDIKGEATAAKRYTYVFGSSELLYKTPISRFLYLQEKGISFEHIKAAFSVEALSDEFFNRYREQYADFVAYVTGKRYVKSGNKCEERTVGYANPVLMTAFGYDEKRVRDYVKKMMGRLTFLHFLQRKGWLCGDLNYMQHLFERSCDQSNYLEAVLEPLFFGILDTKPAEREALFREKHWDLKLLAEWKEIPYLNGGLFESDEEDSAECRFPATYFRNLFQFFSEYNFTIDENDPSDAEIGVDPEMLGKIFENLLEDNKDKGAFYTPKEIVRYMCQESLIAYLETNTSIAVDKLRRFVLSPEEGVTDIPDNKKAKLLAALTEVKICDPAIGSGAFPMGLLNELLHCREVLSGEHYDRAEIKKSIIQNNIYGVDIEKGAVDIARLRFWLSIVVDEETPSPLPNLDYKIMQGNSLLESYKGLDLSKLTYERESAKDTGEWNLFDNEKNHLQKQVSQLLNNYYSCSDHARKDQLRKQISETITSLLTSQSFDCRILSELKQLNLAGNDQFFLWHTWFSDVFNRADGKNGFDIVIANPPYIKELGNERVFATVKDSSWGKKYHAGKMDYWYYFLHKSIEIANRNGTISFITSRYWINSSGAKKIIKHVSNETSFVNIVDIGKLKIFDNVIGHHMISILTKDKSQDICRYLSVSDDVNNIVKNIFTSNRLIKREDLFSNGEIVIENRILANTTKTLGDICNISQGIVEASDKISPKMFKNKPINNHYIGEGIFALSIEEYHNLNLSELEKSIMVLYEGYGCLSRYCINYNKTRRLIYADTQNRNRIAEDRQFKNLKEHLDRMSEYITSTYKPYGLHRARKYGDFAQPKLIGPSMFVQPCFSYDDHNLFVGMSYNIITSKDNSSLFFILGIINSKYAQDWFYSNAKHRGSGVDVGVDKLRSFPIPDTTLIQQKPIIYLVEKVVKLKQSNPNTETTDLEHEIDQLVYQLYGLTEKEIAIIEESFKQK